MTDTPRTRREPAQHNPPSVGSPHAQPRRHRATDARRGTAHERGYTSRWAEFSRAFRRANPLCEYCLAKGHYVPSEVTDHDLPHGGDPTLFWDNTWTALCHACHNGTKARAEARYSGDDLLRWVARRKAKKPRHAGGPERMGG